MLQIAVNGPDLFIKFQQMCEKLGKPTQLSFFPFRSTKVGTPMMGFRQVRHGSELIKQKYTSGENYKLLQFPPKDAFRDVDEFIIAISYGEDYEWNFVRNQYTLLETGKHKIQLVMVGDNITLGKITLDPELSVEDLQLNQHATMKLMIEPPSHLTNYDKKVRCKAILHEDIIQIGSRNELTVLIVNKAAQKFDDMASVFPAVDGDVLDCQISADFSANHISRQEAALMTMRRDNRFNQLFLNQDACVGPTTDPSDFSGKSQKVQKAVMDDVIR